MKKHLLLIDDDKQVVRYFTEGFAAADSRYKCTRADGIAHAQQVLEFIYPDIIFINLDPQAGRALEFIYALKHKNKFRQTEVIAYARQIQYYKALCEGYGVYRHIPSPQSVDDIYQAIDIRFVGGSGMSTGLSA